MVDLLVATSTFSPMSPNVPQSPGMGGGAIPIHYNQPVILQCMSSGKTSPVFIIRKIEKGSNAVGSYYSGDPSCNIISDPVSQLHKIALEVYNLSSPSQQGHYFSCNQDSICTANSDQGQANQLAN